MLLFKIGINVPRIPALGLVIEGLQQIAARELLGPACVRFRRRKRFGVAAFIEQAGDTARLWIDFDADELVFQRISRGLHSRAFRNWFQCRAHEIDFISESWRAGQKQNVGTIGLRIHRQQL